MMQYPSPIYLSEHTYARLEEMAGQMSESVHDVAEWLLLWGMVKDGKAEPDEPDVKEALAAVQRLTTLFADVPADKLDAVFDDPMIKLENYDLDSALL